MANGDIEWQPDKDEAQAAVQGLNAADMKIETERLNPGSTKRMRVGVYGTGPVCRVCAVDLSDLKPFFQKYRVCETHMKAESVEIDAKAMRFCQQCGRFHELPEFEGAQRTCREKLAKHAARRRQKRQAQKRDQHMPPPHVSGMQMPYGTVAIDQQQQQQQQALQAAAAQGMNLSDPNLAMQQLMGLAAATMLGQLPQDQLAALLAAGQQNSNAAGNAFMANSVMQTILSAGLQQQQQQQQQQVAIAHATSEAAAAAAATASAPALPADGLDLAQLQAAQAAVSTTPALPPSSVSMEGTMGQGVVAAGDVGTLDAAAAAGIPPQPSAAEVSGAEAAVLPAEGSGQTGALSGEATAETLEAAQQQQALVQQMLLNPQAMQQLGQLISQDPNNPEVQAMQAAVMQMQLGLLQQQPEPHAALPPGDAAAADAHQQLLDLQQPQPQQALSVVENGSTVGLQVNAEQAVQLQQALTSLGVSPEAVAAAHPDAAQAAALQQAVAAAAIGQGLEHHLQQVAAEALTQQGHGQSLQPQAAAPEAAPELPAGTEAAAVATCNQL